MGTDVHTYLEKKNENNEWEFVRGGDWWEREKHGCAYGINDDRNYSLFRDLASVRGKGSYGNSPRGLPEGLSEYVFKEVDEWGEDFHSKSWMPLTEAVIHWKNHNPLPQDEFENPMHPTVAEEQMFEINHGCDCHYGYHFGKVDVDKIDDYRLVFCFDN